MFLVQQVQVRVATIPAGKDPCDFCLSEGVGALERLVSEAPDAIQYAWDRHRSELESAWANPAERRRVVEDFLRLVVTTSTYGAIDEVRRGQLAQHIAHMLNVTAGDLQELMRRLGRRTRPQASGQGRQEPPDEGLSARAERDVLEVLLNRPALFDGVAERLDPRDFGHPQLRAIAEVVWRLGEAGRCDFQNLLSVEALAEHGALLADLATAGEKRGNYERTLQGAAEAMLYRRARTEFQQVKANGYSDDTLRRISQADPLRLDPLRRPTIR